MMKKTVQLLSAIIFVVVSASNAMAVGLGGYGSFDYSGGDTRIKHKTYFGTDTSGSINNIIAGGGLVFDTNILGPSVFNYRLKIGGDKFYNDGESDFEGAGAHFFNTFGFKVFGSSKVRLWIGPGFGFQYIKGISTTDPFFGEEDTGILEEYWSTVSPYPGDPSLWIGNFGLHSAKATYTLYSFEAGLVFGMNFAVSNIVVISAEVAAKYSLFWGERSRSVTTWFSLTEWSNATSIMDYRSGKDTITSHCGAVDVTLGILFRFDEGNIYRGRG
ncbi:MAG TPA: hypothetical protein PKX40_21445 [Spirochaetota bacterium]|nr:hypothetical protein [Spirochaetota bacterium]